MVSNPLTREYDLIVVGGGMAGICAAMAAARQGLTTALIEEDKALGGDSGSRARRPIVGADVWGLRPYARETGILEELRLENAARNPDGRWGAWEALLEDCLRRQPSLDLYAGWDVRAAHMGEGGAVASITAVRSRPRDAGGDGGTVAASVSADESEWPGLASDGGDFASEDARALRRDTEIRLSSALFADCTGAGELGVRAGADRRADAEPRTEYGESMAPETGPPTASGEAGVRLLGDVILTENDLREGRMFEDAVAYGGWPLAERYGWREARDLAGSDAWLPGLYSIPLRSLYSRNVPNLLMAGSVASATAVAHRSTGVMGTAAVMGQAIGTAAAVCRRRGADPRTVAAAHIAEVQQSLLKDDAYLIGRISEDPHDLARYARAVATSKLAPEYIPSNVINGLTRPTADWPQMWASDPKVGFPTNIEIDFVERRVVDTVHLTFDTGLSRPLALTDDPEARAQMVNGPQPETVRDYTILAGLTTRWNPVVEVTGNVQRRRIHRFDPVRVNRLRIVVHATHGVDHARIFEVRCYHANG